LAPIFEDLNKSEKVSEIKPPLTEGHRVEKIFLGWVESAGMYHNSRLL
jgi:hypothetical protein